MVGDPLGAVKLHPIFFSTDQAPSHSLTGRSGPAARRSNAKAEVSREGGGPAPTHIKWLPRFAPGQDPHAGLSDAVVEVFRVADHFHLPAGAEDQVLIDDER